MKKLIGFVIVFANALFALGQHSNQEFASIDKYVATININKNKTVDELSKILVLNATNDLEKVRAIYVWIARNVAYDLDSYRSGTLKEQSPQSVFSSRIAVCQGYSELFNKLCKLNNIPCEVISGYSKGYGYTYGKKFKTTDHAWVSVKIDKKWFLIDPTWGAGYIDENDRYVNKFNNDFFLTDPKVFILKHLPSDPMWQLLDIEVSISDFEKDSSYLKKLFTVKEKKFNYLDTITKWETLDSSKKIINSSQRIIRYNPENSDALYKLGWFYYQQAWNRMSTLNSPDVQKSKAKAVPLAKEAVDYLNEALKYMNKINTKDVFYGEEVKQKKVVIGKDIKTLQNFIN